MASKRIVAIMLWVAVVLVIAISGQTVAAQPETDNVPPLGLRALFNGKDFTGW